jgi:hypothetical protein
MHSDLWHIFERRPGEPALTANVTTGKLVNQPAPAKVLIMNIVKTLKLKYLAVVKILYVLFLWFR